jgi:FtsP/CotA-like multicopper oxidase with cupredoxin domain
VYQPNQDPASASGANPVGRWDFGPLFWPIFPAINPLPSGSYGDVTSIPEAYFDTPVINGTAYPTLTVAPKAYRFRILNASNDRYLNLGLYKADTANVAPQLDPNGNPIFNAAGVQQFFVGTEVKLVRALAIDAAGTPPEAKNVGAGMAYDPACQCQYPDLLQNNNVASSGPGRAWPIDDRRGGAPDPTSVGPDIIAIGNDGGFLPNAVDIPSQPITYEANRRSITVNNAYGYGLLLGPAERADTIIDFSAYAGQTLIVYNDAPAPFPFSDERNDYYSGDPDLTSTGGTFATNPGYGPNTRTMMQIKVSATAPAAPYDVLKLKTELPKAYAASQPAPLVPAVAYNTAFGTNDPDVYGHIALGAAAQPTLDFTTSVNNVVTLTGLKLIVSGGVINNAGLVVPNVGSGSGYDPKNPPTVVFNNTVNKVDCNPSGNSASATATVDPKTFQVSAIENFVAGSGYICAPTVSFINTTYLASIALNNGGAAYTAPVVSFTGGGGTGAEATATIDANGVVTAISVTKAGTGYTSAPNVVITDATGTGAVATAVLTPTLGVGAQVAVQSSATNFHSYPVSAISEQELFDDRGRYNKTGGVEMPFTNAINQTTVPLNYIDAATESIKDGDIQVWKISVNGLFSNSLSFNLADVQLLNRVGWDGTVKPPSSNEVGWKNTLRMNPLEDVVIAVRAKRSSVPFGLPASSRSRDPSKALGMAGTGLGFTVGQGVPQLTSAVNVTEQFDNEFVWNSAMLSNSENDFMRPIVFHPTVITPVAPTGLADPMGNGTLTWTDPTPAGVATTLANPQNEIGFKIMMAKVDVFGNLGAYAEIAKVPANTTQWVDVAPATDKSFAVVAYNVAGDSPQSASFAQELPKAPTVFTADFTADTTDAATLVNNYNSVTLTWSGATTSNKLEVWRNGALIAILQGASTSYVDKTVTAVMSYQYQIKAVNALQPVATGAALSALLDVTTPMIPVTAPTALTATANAAGTAVTVRWTDLANNETNYWVEVSADNGLNFAAPIKITRTAAQRTAVNGVVTLTPNFVSTPGNVYVFRVTAVNVTGGATSTSAPVLSAPVDLSAPLAPTAPLNLVANLATATRATLTWTDNATTENAYVVTITNSNTTTTSVPTTTTVTVNRTAAQSASSGLPVTYNAVVALGNSYTFSVAARAVRFGLASDSAIAGPVTVDVVAPASPTLVDAVAGAAGSFAATVNWTDAANATSYTVQRATVTGTTVGAFATVGTVLPGVQSFTNTALRAGRSYQYQVRANNGAGNSAYVASTTVVAQ